MADNEVLSVKEVSGKAEVVIDATLAREILDTVGKKVQTNDTLLNGLVKKVNEINGRGYRAIGLRSIISSLNEYIEKARAGNTNEAKKLALSLHLETIDAIQEKKSASDASLRATAQAEAQKKTAEAEQLAQLEKPLQAAQAKQADNLPFWLGNIVKYAAGKPRNNPQE